MTEAERLQKIVVAQEKELRRLRKLLSTARVAMASFAVEGETLQVTVTAVGVDEYYFTEQCKPELQKIAEELAEKRMAFDEKMEDAITGEQADGAVIP